MTTKKPLAAGLASIPLRLSVAKRHSMPHYAWRRAVIMTSTSDYASTSVYA